MNKWKHRLFLLAGPAIVIAMLLWIRHLLVQPPECQTTACACCPVGPTTIVGYPDGGVVVTTQCAE